VGGREESTFTIVVFTEPLCACTDIQLKTLLEPLAAELGITVGNKWCSFTV